MSKDDINGEAGEEPPRKRLSDEVVEAVKRELNSGVGYRSPPRHTRFKKGQSGNPKGRPKSSNAGLGGNRSANRLALTEAERMTTLKDATGTHQVPAIEAVIRAQYAAAARGNAYAQRHIIDRYERAERERQNEIQEENEIWQAYIARRREEMAEAAERGDPPPNPLPHPDDVVIDDETGVRFLGPLNKEQALKLKETCNFRDVLLMQYALDIRGAGRADSGDPDDGPSAALLFVHLLDHCIPARHRLSDDEIMRRLRHYGTMRKRTLLKAIYRAWRGIGAQVPRGRTMPSLRVGKEWAEFAVDLVKRSTDGRLDIINSTEEELQAAITEVYVERRHRLVP